MQRFIVWAFLIVGLLGCVTLPAWIPVHAQIASTDPFTFTTSPEYPGPYQTLDIQPSSTQFDIANATVKVTVDGSAFYSGTGGATISVPLGGPGSSTKIVITVTNAGKAYTKQFTVRPAQVALVVEPSSTVHPYYEGKGLVNPQGNIRLIAIPDLRTTAGVAIDPASLVYTWRMDTQILQSDSGIGRSVLTAQAPERYRDVNVSVTVATQDGSLSAQATTPISPVDPIVRIYRNDPLLGPLFDTALSGSISLADTEDTYRVVPYYFSAIPTFDWTVNGADSGTAQDITVRAAGNGQGTAQLGITATQSGTSQEANGTLSVTFGQKQSLGIFGL